MQRGIKANPIQLKDIMDSQTPAPVKGYNNSIAGW